MYGAGVVCHGVKESACISGIPCGAAVLLQNGRNLGWPTILEKRKNHFILINCLQRGLLDFSSVELVSHGIINDDNNSGGTGVWVVKFLCDGQNKWLCGARITKHIHSLLHQIPSMLFNRLCPFLYLERTGSTFQQGFSDGFGWGSHTFNLSSLPILVEEQNITGFNALGRF